uniref:Gx transporter family protein n=1 Tax=Agathobacter sp. TaxID=2021311 RepID=UPI004055C21F
MKTKTAYLGVFLALALICSYIERLIPFSIGIPGIKLGLANIVVVFALYTLGTKEALLISFARIIISAFMFGNAVGIAYSLVGGLLSFAVMAGLKKTKLLHCISVSVAGGVFHNIGQILVATFLVSNYYVLYYIPVLMVAGFVTGGCIGVLAQEIFLRLGRKRFVGIL